MAVLGRTKSRYLYDLGIVSLSAWALFSFPQVVVTRGGGDRRITAFESSRRQWPIYRRLALMEKQAGLYHIMNVSGECLYLLTARKAVCFIHRSAGHIKVRLMFSNSATWFVPGGGGGERTVRLGQSSTVSCSPSAELVWFVPGGRIIIS
jgi:hypothetical protein